MCDDVLLTASLITFFNHPGTEMTNHSIPRYKARVRTLSTIGRALSTAGVLTAALLASSAAQAGLVFNFTFEADAVQMAPDFTAGQKAAVIKAGELFSAMFATHFTNSATLDFTVTSKTDGLASAGSVALGSSGKLIEVVQNKVLTGVDANGAGNDGFINLNLATPFVYDPNAPVDFATQIDLFSVLDHELTHALGFISYASVFEGTGTYSTFDTFLKTNSGVSLIQGGAVDLAALADAQATNALFSGPNAIAGYGIGAPIQGPGGDLSHLGTVAFSAPVGGTADQNGLMLCCGGLNVTGQGREYNAAEIGILKDLGYTAVEAIPEPGTYAMVLSGLALLAFTTKRAKR
jgi:hypothetical protein